MKITSVKPYIMWGGDAGRTQYSSTLWGSGAGRNWLFVKVETDEEVHGWGEGSLVNQTRTIAESVHAVAEDIIGHDPGAIERHWQVMFLHNRYRGGVIINSALSALDQALWDIKGKVLGVPVYELLGGAVRRRIRNYAGAGDAENARARIKEGFTAIKGGAWYTDKDIDERQVVPRFRESVAELRAGMSKTYGEQDGSAYNGHVGCTCSGRITGRWRANAHVTESGKGLTGSRGAIESSKRPTAVAGTTPSGKSQISGPGVRA